MAIEFSLKPGLICFPDIHYTHIQSRHWELAVQDLKEGVIWGQIELQEGASIEVGIAAKHITIHHRLCISSESYFDLQPPFTCLLLRSVGVGSKRKRCEWRRCQDCAPCGLCHTQRICSQPVCFCGAPRNAHPQRTQHSSWNVAHHQCWKIWLLESDL